jgi:hypothetical protein
MRISGLFPGAIVDFSMCNTYMRAAKQQTERFFLAGGGE